MNRIISVLLQYLYMFVILLPKAILESVLRKKPK